MKVARNKTVLGVAVGERSLLAAEVTIDDRAQVLRVAEMPIDSASSFLEPDRFATAFAAFRQASGFTARSVVLGLPAKWLVVRSKEVPPATESALVSLLRLGAEAEFTSELKDLVYDFAGHADESAPTSVLLMATQKKYLDAAEKVCELSKLQLLAVTSSALALGEASGRTDAGAMVLVVGATGAELTAHRGRAISAIRHLRSPEPAGPFLSELRRAVSTLPATAGERQLIVWGGKELTPAALQEQLKLPVRCGNLLSLGVETSPGINGDGPRFGAPVALALSALERRTPVDFLHSRLAPPKSSLIPRWAFYAAGAAILVVALSIWAYSSLQRQRTELASLQSDLVSKKPAIDAAEAFVAKVKLASRWHSADPRYLTCLREVTLAIPDDEQTYATSVLLRENRPQGDASKSKSGGSDPSLLSGQLAGKTTEQQRVEQILDRMRHMPVFTDVKLVGATESSRREVQFSITFTFVPPRAPAHK